MSVKLLYLAAVAAIVGCATTGRSAAASHSGSLLTSEEIAATHADVTSAYDAVARLRPNWLASHGVTTAQSGSTQYASVFVDGQPYGDLNSLRTIPAFNVGNIRYYNITEAGARFGLRGGSSGVIDVTTMTPGRS